MKKTAKAEKQKKRVEKKSDKPEKNKRAEKFKTGFKEYAWITFGIFLIALGVYFFRFPNNISTGGVTGLAVVLTQVFPAMSPSTFVLIFNILFLIVGFIVLGKDFGVKTVYGSLLLSGCVELFDLLFLVFKVPGDLLPLTVSAANPNGEPVLELFFAVALPSVGSAIIFYNRGSSGGTDIVAMILHKYTSLDSGTALLVSDFALVLLTFYNFTTQSFSPQTGLLSLCGLVMKSLVIDNVIADINQSKYFLIITTHRAEVEEYITKKLKRGATVWTCEGAYTHREEYAFVAVMNRFQAYKFRQFIKQTDPMSFVVVTNSSEIVGKGFKEI